MGRYQQQQARRPAATGLFGTFPKKVQAKDVTLQLYFLSKCEVRESSSANVPPYYTNLEIVF
jgi:hypothetical protein